MMKSIEGSTPIKVTMDKELASALMNHKRCLDAFNFIMFNGDIKPMIPFFNSKIDEYESIFKKYNLDKYDIRAHYDFVN